MWCYRCVRTMEMKRLNEYIESNKMAGEKNDFNSINDHIKINRKNCVLYTHALLHAHSNWFRRSILHHYEPQFHFINSFNTRKFHLVFATFIELRKKTTYISIYIDGNGGKERSAEKSQNVTDWAKVRERDRLHTIALAWKSIQLLHYINSSRFSYGLQMQVRTHLSIKFPLYLPRLFL